MGTRSHTGKDAPPESRLSPESRDARVPASPRAHGPGTVKPPESQDSGARTRRAGLTAREVESKPPGEYTDSNGLVLRVREDSRTWALRYRTRQGSKRGPQRRLTLGVHNGPLAVDLAALGIAEFEPPKRLTLDGARACAAALIGLAARGVDPAERLAAADLSRAEREAEATRRATEGTLTLGALVDRMIAAREEELRPATVDGWRTLRRAALADLADADPAALTGRDVRRWHRGIGATGKKVTANRALELLSVTFGWAMRTEDDRGEPLVSATPCTGIEPFEERPRDRVLSSDELRAVWGALTAEPFGDAVRLLLWTGARKSEALGVEWTEVDIKGKLWTVPAGRSKSGESRRVPLSRPAVKMLEARRKADPAARWVFASPVKMVGPVRTLQSVVRGVQKRSETSGWTVHDLRRTVRTGLAALAVRPEVGEFVLGHKVGGIRAVYDRYEPLAEAQAALEAWARRLASIVAGEAPADNVVTFAR